MRKREEFVEGVDRPIPLLYLANGGEDAAKMRMNGQLFSDQPVATSHVSTVLRDEQVPEA